MPYEDLDVSCGEGEFYFPDFHNNPQSPKKTDVIQATTSVVVPQVGQYAIYHKIGEVCNWLYAVFEGVVTSRNLHLPPANLIHP